MAASRAKIVNKKGHEALQTKPGIDMNKNKNKNKMKKKL